MIPLTNIHESEYTSLDRKPLPISSVPSTDNLVHTPRTNTPIRLNSPHISSISDKHRSSSPPHLASQNISNFPNLNGRSTTPCSIETGQEEEDDGEPLLKDNSELPTLLHKWSHTHSILCCVASPKNKLLFCGTQDGKVLIYDIPTYSLAKIIETGNQQQQHQQNSILAICLTKEEDYLFVAGSDSLVKIYDLKHDEIRCTHVIYSLVDIGDIFSINWCDDTSTVYVGAQNASILWCHVTFDSVKHHHDIDRLPHFRYDKFFDSKGPGGSQNTLQTKHDLYRRYSKNGKSKETKLVESRPEDIIRFAHNGYVYCLESVNSTIGDYKNDNGFLLSGGGDGIVNIWSFGDNTLDKLTSLENDESVLSMKIQDSLLYVGLGDCSINVWDLLTLQMIRSFQFEENIDEVLNLDVHHNSIFKVSSSGLIKLSMNSQNKSDAVLMSVQAEDGFINAVKTFDIDNKNYLMAGGSKLLTLWDITDPHDENVTSPSGPPISSSSSTSLSSNKLSNDDMLCVLKKYVSFKTISKSPQLYLEDSRHCAQFLIKLFTRFGSYQNKLLPVENGNPIVFAEFKANGSTTTSQSNKPRILWYAHYDVVDATKSEAKEWKTDPFVLTAEEGNLYARGVTDNKGPTLAAVYSVAELYKKQELNCDVVFIIEGEEECGSIGFQQVITEHKSLIGQIDWIMLSNSYWLDDLTPCLNYGLRGVINASVTIKSDKPDRHAGVDGGVSKEPTMDMMYILSKLMDPITRKIELPGFYNDVLPLTESEEKLYKKVADYLGFDTETLKVKWREPSLTIHKIQVSGPNNNTVIPQLVHATISMRIVPNQDLESIKKSLIETLHTSFKQLKSENHLQVEIFHEAEPWLGDYQNKVYSILYENISKHWQQEPLFIREGGSIPSIRFLEKCFNAQAAQIPCGQASDNAHLKDEKLRIVNLYKLRSILTDTFKELGKN
ncbi:DUG2 Probable di- and tripeptidase DUG2 [Candida maltosa Xu316]|uniref:Peptidase M20 dimerisation domain-containing protein n=1 Tax=Candida maltosa (strain Xu316) TaxID=1245528 RepID=M3J6Y6_CANMX|nr:hypothetical protein G210_1702 [Candida maltosa Xu316]